MNDCIAYDSDTMNILLVDDHPVFRSGLAVMLRNLFENSTIQEIGDEISLMKAIAE